jgi:hypothetical protein
MDFLLLIFMCYKTDVVAIKCQATEDQTIHFVICNKKCVEKSFGPKSVGQKIDLHFIMAIADTQAEAVFWIVS